MNRYGIVLWYFYCPNWIDLFWDLLNVSLYLLFWLCWSFHGQICCFILIIVRWVSQTLAMDGGVFICCFWWFICFCWFEWDGQIQAMNIWVFIMITIKIEKIEKGGRTRNFFKISLYPLLEHALFKLLTGIFIYFLHIQTANDFVYLSLFFYVLYMVKIN